MRRRACGEFTRHERERLDRSLTVEPRPEPAIPEHEGRGGVAGGRLRRWRAHRSQEHGRRRALRRHAPERSEHADDIRALWLIGDEQQVGALERAEHAAAEGSEARIAGHEQGSLDERRRVAVDGQRAAGRQATRELCRLVGEALGAHDGVLAARERERPGQRPVGVASRPARGERRIDAVSAQLVGELPVAQCRPGDLERGGVGSRRRDDQHLRHRPEFRSGPRSPSATLAR